LQTNNFKTCHGFGVFSAKAIESLSDYLENHGMMYSDLLEISPYEFSWYNFWLEKSQVIRVVEREPIFETIHMDHHHLAYALKSVKLDDLARGYVGVVVNSGHSRDQGVLDFETDFVDTLARNVGYRTLVSAFAERALQRMPRVRKIFKV
jgi:hypothetical protein